VKAAGQLGRQQTNQRPNAARLETRRNFFSQRVVTASGTGYLRTLKWLPEWNPSNTEKGRSDPRTRKERRRPHSDGHSLSRPIGARGGGGESTNTYQNIILRPVGMYITKGNSWAYV
jgi:hypothetical protein